MSKTLLLCHVVFVTKHRQNTINPNQAREMYNVMYGILRKHNCFVHRINGMCDHVHLLFDLSPTVALSKLMQSLKGDTSRWLTSNPKFLTFQGWGAGYYAVSVSPPDLESVKQYIINQQSHHIGVSSLDELETMIRNSGLTWYIDDWL